ncbi:MAG TPA: YitT family protein [Caldilineae bacterium]|nr:YitT family protein [Caldilineae bacterium]
MPRERALRVMADYMIIIFGALLIALAADLFLIPNQVISAGLFGIAVILHYLFGTPVGAVTMALNVPLFLAMLRWGGGWRSGVRTVVAVAAMSIAVDALAGRLPVITTDPLLYTLYGGILDGLGIGLIFRAQGTTGGIDIIAQLMQRRRGSEPGQVLLVLSGLTLAAAAVVFGIERALYAMIVATASSMMVDLIQQGLGRAKVAFIVSTRHERIRSAILEDMERGITILQAEGGYTGATRPVLMCAVARSEVSRLKRLISHYDPDAFIVIAPAQEVLGEGFRGLRTTITTL